MGKRKRGGFKKFRKSFKKFKRTFKKSSRRFGKKSRKASMNKPYKLNIARGILVPDRLLVRLKYHDLVAISSAGFTSDCLYRGNSIYDPNYTITGGNSATGFLDWSKFYNSYKVYSSSIKILVWNKNTTWPIRAYIFPTINNSSLSTGDKYLQDQRFVKHRIISPMSINAARIERLKHYCSTSVIYGVPKNAIRIEEDYASSISGNPLLQWYWYVRFESVDLATNLTASNFEAELEYYVEFFSKQEEIQ